MQVAPFLSLEQMYVNAACWQWYEMGGRDNFNN